MAPLDTQNHFAIFSLPMRFHLEEEKLREEFLRLSREYHPDYHGDADAQKRSDVLRLSALINNAYRQLRDPQRRAEYLLSLLAPNLESNKQAVPPDLLESFFDIQEAGEELRAARLSGDGAALTKAEATIAPHVKTVADALSEQRRALVKVGTRLDKALDADDQLTKDKLLAELRLILDRINYLRTVTRNLH